MTTDPRSMLRPGPERNELAQRIRELYEGPDKPSIKMLADRVGRSSNFVRGLLLTAKTPMRPRGVSRGRRSKVTPEACERGLEMRAAGKPWPDVAEALGLSRTNLHAARVYLRKYAETREEPSGGLPC